MYRFSWPSLLSFFGWYCMALVRACMVYCFMHAISRAVACCLAHHLGFVFVLFFFSVFGASSYLYLRACMAHAF
jgi:hypothetical protein